MLVLFYIKSVVIIPALLNSELQAFDAVLHCALIEALTLAGIAVGSEETSVGLKLGHRFLGGLLEDDNHEGSDKEGTICQFDTVVGGFGIVVDLGVSLVLLGLKEFLKFAAVPVYVGQVEWAKVVVEGGVSQIVINVEEEGVLNVLWGLSVRDPVQFVYKVS